MNKRSKSGRKKSLSLIYVSRVFISVGRIALKMYPSLFVCTLVWDFFSIYWCRCHSQSQQGCNSLNDDWKLQIKSILLNNNQCFQINNLFHNLFFLLFSFSIGSFGPIRSVWVRWCGLFGRIIWTLWHTSEQHNQIEMMAIYCVFVCVAALR